MSSLFTILLIVCAAVGLPLLTAISAAKKGHSFWPFYALGILVPIGLIVSYFIKDHGFDATPAWFQQRFPPVLGVVGWVMTGLFAVVAASPAIWLVFVLLCAGRIYAWWSGRSEAAAAIAAA